MNGSVICACLNRAGSEKPASRRVHSMRVMNIKAGEEETLR